MVVVVVEVTVEVVVTTAIATGVVVVVAPGGLGEAEVKAATKIAAIRRGGGIVEATIKATEAAPAGETATGWGQGQPMGIVLEQAPMGAAVRRRVSLPARWWRTSCPGWVEGSARCGKMG